MVTETVSFLHKQIKSGKNVLVEGANAAMLDIDFGEFRSLFFAIPDPFLLGTFSEPFIEIKDCFSEVEKIDYVFGSVQMYS